MVNLKINRRALRESTRGTGIYQFDSMASETVDAETLSNQAVARLALAVTVRPLTIAINKSHRGQCKVMIERTSNSNDSDKDLDRFKSAKLFNSMYPNSIVDVNSSGFGKLSVVVRSARDENAILDDKSLENKGLRASIPSYFVTCQGVILGISLEMSENLVILNNVYKINPIEAR